MNYSYGIYAYVDKRDDRIVYVGKDSNISKNKRHKQHHYRSHYNRQPINSILQNNPGRYEYKVLEKDIDNEDDLNKLEIAYIEKYDTYNNGFNFTEGGENNPKYWLGKPRSEEERRKISKGNNSTGVYRVYKHTDKRYKQGFTWRYQYTDKNGKEKGITSTDFSKLMLKVTLKDLPWRIVDIDNALDTINNV